MAEENPTTIEEWRKLERYPDHEVSSFGRVRSNLRNGRILRQKMPKRPHPQYLRVSIRGDVHAKVRVHKMVAEAFLGPCPPGKEINHIDGIKTNNYASNLEYLTHRENIDHYEKRRLSITVTVGV